MNKFYITGDTHGKFERIYEFCKKMKTDKSDILCILGDVGINYFLNKNEKGIKQELSQLPITLFCIHGNHEERPFNIQTYKTKLWNQGIVYYEEKYPNLIFAKDGEIYNINGKSILVIGGAYSVDKDYRILMKYRWFPDEQPNEKIKKYVERQVLKQNKFDLILSHTCPIETEPRHLFLGVIDQKKVDKSTEIWLQKISDFINFDNWYFGHFHGNWDNGKYHLLFETYKEIN